MGTEASPEKTMDLALDNCVSSMTGQEEGDSWRRDRRRQTSMSWISQLPQLPASHRGLRRVAEHQPALRHFSSNTSCSGAAVGREGSPGQGCRVRPRNQKVQEVEGICKQGIVLPSDQPLPKFLSLLARLWALYLAPTRQMTNSLLRSWLNTLSFESRCRLS